MFPARETMLEKQAGHNSEATNQRLAQGLLHSSQAWQCHSDEQMEWQKGVFPWYGYWETPPYKEAARQRKEIHL